MTPSTSRDLRDIVVELAGKNIDKLLTEEDGDFCRMMDDIGEFGKDLTKNMSKKMAPNEQAMAAKHVYRCPGFSCPGYRQKLDLLTTSCSICCRDKLNSKWEKLTRAD
jgi:hypothetical protein